jgi:hypothetical protein
MGRVHRTAAERELSAGTGGEVSGSISDGWPDFRSSPRVDEDGFVTFQARVGEKIGGSKETTCFNLRVQNSCGGGVCTFFRKATRNSSLWRLLRIIIAKRYTSPSAVSCCSVASAQRHHLLLNRLLQDSPVAEHAEDRSPCCPKCQTRMQGINFQSKPSWRFVMWSSHRPSWYRCRDG